MVRSYSNQAQGGWLKAQAQASLPRAGHDFARARDPLYARQLDDIGKTESQRRGEQSGSGKIPAKKQTRKTDKPKPELKPPPHTRAGFSKGGRWQWLSAQQQATFANITEAQKQNGTARNKSLRQKFTPQQRPTQTP